MTPAIPRKHNPAKNSPPVSVSRIFFPSATQPRLDPAFWARVVYVVSPNSAEINGTGGLGLSA
jgi:hypothetical protein